MGEKLSAVLPLAARKNGELDYKRIQILLFTLKKQDAQKWLEKIYIVTSEDVTDLIRKEISQLTHCIEIAIIEENTLLPDLAQYPRKDGYRKQMLIKIGISSLIPGKFFLTLDSDVICLQRISLEQLIVNDKSLIQYEEKQLHSDWWRASSAILSTELDLTTLGLSVTPAILSTQICRSLIDDIDKRYSQSWVSVLMDMEYRSFWTEYTLYFSYAQSRGYVEMYHLLPADSRNIPMRDDSYSIWFSEDIEKFNKVKQLQPVGLFGVLQSTSGISLEAIMDYLPHILQIPSSDQELQQLKSLLGIEE